MNTGEETLIRNYLIGQVVGMQVAAGSGGSKFSGHLNVLKDFEEAGQDTSNAQPYVTSWLKNKKKYERLLAEINAKNQRLLESHQPDDEADDDLSAEEPRQFPRRQGRSTVL